MDLSSIKVKIKNKKPKRLGRGPGSGGGKTSGRGHKGAGQRKGKRLPYVGFRGGNLPLVRTLPKRGFHSLRGRRYQLVHLQDIQERLGDISEITPQVLRKFNLIKNAKLPIKVLANIKGDFTKKVVVKADAFSAKAKKLIEAKGGETECLNR